MRVALPFGFTALQLTVVFTLYLSCCARPVFFHSLDPNNSHSFYTRSFSTKNIGVAFGARAREATRRPMTDERAGWLSGLWSLVTGTDDWYIGRFCHSLGGPGPSAPASVLAAHDAVVDKDLDAALRGVVLVGAGDAVDVIDIAEECAIGDAAVRYAAAHLIRLAITWNSPGCTA